VHAAHDPHIDVRGAGALIDWRYQGLSVGAVPRSGRQANAMILKPFRRTPRDDSIARLYGTIVAQARAPAFYQIYGVPDTVNGRLEMIILHTVLVLRRLEGEAGPIRVLGQGLFDRFCRDMEDSLREMGVGDLAVPRNMRRIGEAFYGRQGAYGAALDAPHGEQLAAALQRNVFADGAEREAACQLAAYVREAVRGLAAQDRFERAEVAFPDPEQVFVRRRQTRP
jgi:cytochrome b pre-mRNA-processing protein 3